MYIVHCKKVKKDDPMALNKVRHEIIENYLIAIGGKLNSDQTHRVTRSIAINDEASILCESYNQAIYIESIFKNANGGNLWEFEIINIDNVNNSINDDDRIF